MDDVKLTEGVAFELKPGKEYLLIFPRGSLSRADAARLPFKGVTALIDGNPKDVKIIEDNRKATEEKDAATT
jgi:hypothetical protein